MTPELSAALMVLVRYALAALFSGLATKGLVGQNDIATLANAATTVVIGVAGLLGTVAWALYRSRKAAKIADVAAMPEVTSIHTTPDVAAAQPSDKVVPSPPAAP